MRFIKILILILIGTAVKIIEVDFMLIISIFNSINNRLLVNTIKSFIAKFLFFRWAFATYGK